MRTSCIWALTASLLWLALAAGETRIEVDENGDEYELKRFFIQGRQLTGSGSKSQCVVTRRKRASRALPVGGVAVSSQQLSLSLAEHRGSDGLPQSPVELPNGKRRYLALAAVQLADDDDDEEEDDEEEVDDDEEELELDEGKRQEQQQQQKEQPAEPILQQQKQFQAANSGSIVAHVPQGVSVLANAATHTNVGGDAGIVVVESQLPPKVNPQTHAVFELKPLKQQADFAYWNPEEQLEEVNEEDEDDDAFYYGDRYQGLSLYDEYEHFISEDNPVSTSAIWSTGSDEDIDALVDQNKKKKQKKPQQQQQQPQQQQQQQKRKQTITKKTKKKKQQVKRKKQPQQPQNVLASDVEQQKPAAAVAVVSRPSGTFSNNKRKTQPSKRQKKKKKKQSVTNKRRRPSSSSSSSSSSGSSLNVGGYRRRRPTQTEAQRRRRLQQQKRRRQQQLQQQRRRRRRNKIRNGNINGNKRRQYYNDEPIINCIYINKDPVATTTTSTTARPFWNLLGREAAAVDGVRQETPAETPLRRNGDFGQRKRTNLKFVA